MYNVIAQDIISQVGMVSLQRPTEDHTSRAESYNPMPHIQAVDMVKYTLLLYHITINYFTILYYYNIYSQGTQTLLAFFKTVL